MTEFSVDKVRFLLAIPEIPTELIREALTVAGADSRFPHGFKNLAQLGSKYIDACFLEMGYKASLSRGLISDVMTNFNTTRYRALVAKENGIGGLIEYGKNCEETEKILSSSISALVATVHLTRDMQHVRVCLVKLGFLREGCAREMLQKYEAAVLDMSMSNRFPSSASTVLGANITIDDGLCPANIIQPLWVNESDAPGDPESIQTALSCLDCSSFIHPSHLQPEVGAYGQSWTEFPDGDEMTDALPLTRQGSSGPSGELRVPLHGLTNIHFNSEVPEIYDQAPIQSHIHANNTTLRGDNPTISTVLPRNSNKRKPKQEMSSQKVKRLQIDLTERWALALARETERCQSKGKPIPASTFLRQEIQERCLRYESCFQETMVSLLIHIADASAFAHLREALLISNTKDYYQQAPKVSNKASLKERFQVMESLEGEIAYRSLLARYHILELFNSCGGHDSGANITIIHFNTDGGSQFPRRRGHPVRNANADITQRMLAEIYPSLSPGTKEYDCKKRKMHQYRLLASRYQALVTKFGYAILCFIQPYRTTSEGYLGISDSRLRELNESSLKHLVDTLDQSQGDYLRSLCAAAEPLSRYLVYEDFSQKTHFGLENVDEAEILQLPKGSDDLLLLAREIPEGACQ